MRIPARGWEWWPLIIIAGAIGVGFIPVVIVGMLA